MLFLLQLVAPNSNDGFYWPENPFLLSVSVSLKQTFPLEEKKLHFLLITPMISNSSKKILFPWAEISFALAG